MAQELRTIALVAPAFKGINTEDSPIAQDPSFAEIADNAVIDKRGRIASRKGYSVITTTRGDLSADKPLTVIHEFEDNAGNTEILSAGDTKIFKGTTTLTTLDSTSITANDWKVVNFNNKAYFFQKDHEPVVYSSGGTTQKLSTVSGAAGVSSAIYGNEVLSAYGRLWTADITNDTSTVYWSDLLIGHNWSGGTSGSINISKVWPDGYDEIVALAAHNGLLIIFGQHSIVVYQGAEAPATMSLADTVSGVGCVNRNTVQSTGTDVIFLSNTGLRSFGRTIQEKSMPISSLSKTITKDIITLLQNETTFKSVYSPEESFYLLSFVDSNTTYCFDLRGTLENGALRVTRWISSVFNSYARLDNGTLYIGTTDGITEYTGYTDNGSFYRFRYYSPSLTFGDSSRLKFIKKIQPTVFGGTDSTAFVKFAYDFDNTYKTTNLEIGSNNPAEFNIAQYNIDEFTGGKLVVRKVLNATGSGSTVVIGLEADIDGNILSIQEINIMALLGKIV